MIEILRIISELQQLGHTALSLGIAFVIGMWLLPMAMKSSPNHVVTASEQYASLGWCVTLYLCPDFAWIFLGFLLLKIFFNKR